MNKLVEQNSKEVKGFNQRVINYLESDLQHLSPLFQVQGTIDNQGLANYVMTSLIKAYKEQADVVESAFSINPVITTTKAFEGSTKNWDGIATGIKECGQLSLIKYDRRNGEITLLEKCFYPEFVL